MTVPDGAMATAVDRPPDRYHPILIKGFLALLIDPTTTLIVIAIVPALASEFRVGLDVAAWWITGYLAIYVSLMPFVGVLVDRWGHDRVLLGGIMTFVVGTVVLMEARSFGAFLAGRLVQGVGVSCFLPVILAEVSHAVPPTLQARTLTLLELSSGFSGLGTLIAGLLARVWDWRAMFVIALTLAAGTAVTTAYTWQPRSVGRTPVNSLHSAFWFTLALGGVLLAVGAPLQTPTSVRIGLLVSVLAAAWFLFRRPGDLATVFQWTLLRHDVFRWAAVSAGGIAFVVTAKTLIFPIYLARIWDYGPSDVVMLILLNPAGLVAGNLAAGAMARRWSPIRTASVGTVTLAAALGVLLTGIWRQELVLVLLGFIGTSFGGGFTSVALLVGAVPSFSKAAAGSSAGLFGFIRRFGTLLSAALSLPLLEARLMKNLASPGPFLEATVVLMLFTGLLLLGHLSVSRKRAVAIASEAMS